MARTSALLLLGLISTSLASTVQSRACLTSHQANDIVARWTSLAINISSAVADCTVTNNFKFFSDSQNFLEGTPYGSVTGTPSINGKADLIAQQQAAQAPGTPVIPKSFTIFQTLFNCDTITFRWRFHAIAGGTDPNSANVYGTPIEYAGIDVLIVNSAGLITKAYSEWNNGELLQDLGDHHCPGIC